MFHLEIGYHLVSGFCVSVVDRDFLMKETNNNAEITETMLGLLNNSGGAVFSRSNIPDENMDMAKKLVMEKVGHLGTPTDFYSGITISYNHFKDLPNFITEAVLHHEIGHAQDPGFIKRYEPRDNVGSNSLELVLDIDLEIAADNYAASMGHAKGMLVFLGSIAVGEFKAMGIDIKSKEEIFSALAKSEHPNHEVILKRMRNLEKWTKL